MQNIIILKNSLIYILKRLLKANEIKVDEKELEFQLLSHPFYPSLHSLTGVLSHFRINHLALEIPKNIETLNQLPKSFIAYIKDKKNDDFIHWSYNHIYIISKLLIYNFLYSYC